MPPLVGDRYLTRGGILTKGGILRWNTPDPFSEVCRGGSVQNVVLKG